MAQATPVGTPRPPDNPTGWSPRLILSLVSIVALLEALTMNYSMVATGLPLIMADFKTTQGAWIQTIFLLVAAVISPTLGKVADTYGKRKVLLCCVFLAALGSAISAVAPNYAVLIAGRALAGLVVSCLFLSYSLIRDVYPHKIVPLAVAIATSGMGLISVPMPFITGWLIDGFGWRSLFWFFTIILVVVGVGITMTTDETSYRLRSRIDPIGAGLLGAGIGGILIAVSFGADWGWSSAKTMAFLIGGIVLLGLWIVSARIVPEPLIDLGLLTRRSIGLTTITAGTFYGSTALSSTLLPLMCMTPAALGLGYGFGVDAEGYALFQSPLGAATVVGGLIVGVLVGRGVRPRNLAIAGAAVMALGSFGVIAGMDSRALIVVMMIAIGLGTGLGYGSIPNLQFEAVPPQLQASTASMVATSQAMMSAILPVIAFSIMNSHIGVVVDGVGFFSATGMKWALVLCGATALVGLLCAMCIPRHITRLSAPDAEVDDPAPAEDLVAPAAG